MRPPRARDDRGESLVEVLVSVVIMSTAVVALIGGLATAVIMSDTHRKQAQAGAYVRSYAEAIETAVAASPSSYVDACAATAAATYGALYTAPAGFTASPPAVAYWNGTDAFTTTCTTDTGVQRLSLAVSSTDGRATERLVLIIRKPCRSTTDFPGEALCAA